MTYAELTSAGVALIAVLGVTGVGLLIGAFVAAIFLAGVAAVQAAFTSEVWTDFKCILYCAMEDDGSFTEAGWEQVKSKILSTFTGTVSAILYNWANAAGLVGLTNAARSHFAVTGDCSACACEDCSNLDNWEIIYGTLLEQSPGYMRIASAYVSGSNVSVRIANYNNVPDECCQVTYNIISGVVQNQAYYPCGSTDPVFSVPPADTCMYDVGLTNIFTVAFEVEFFFGECP